jgi:hypothetical protein
MLFPVQDALVLETTGVLYPLSQVAAYVQVVPPGALHVATPAPLVHAVQVAQVRFAALHDPP